jgi:hypothetical protein
MHLDALKHLCVLQKLLKSLRHRYVDLEQDEAAPVGLPQREPSTGTRAKRIFNFGFAVRL